ARSGGREPGAAQDIPGGYNPAVAEDGEGFHDCPQAHNDIAAEDGAAHHGASSDVASFEHHGVVDLCTVLDPDVVVQDAVRNDGPRVPRLAPVGQTALTLCPGQVGFQVLFRGTHVGPERI